MVVLASLALASAADELPSGQSVSLYEVLIDDVGSVPTLRFRFIAPDLAASLDVEQTTADMTHLCDTLVLGYLQEHDLAAETVVISLADRETEFGVADPDATQVFEAFTVTSGTCMWEQF